MKSNLLICFAICFFLFNNFLTASGQNALSVAQNFGVFVEHDTPQWQHASRHSHRQQPDDEGIF